MGVLALVLLVPYRDLAVVLNLRISVRRRILIFPEGATGSPVLCNVPGGSDS